MRTFITSLLTAVLLLGCSQGTVLYVATNGNNQASGQKNQPLASLSEAIDRMQQMPSDQGPFVIYLRGGIYQLKETVVLDESCPDNLSIKAYNEEEVSISGGVAIASEGIEAVSGTQFEGYFPFAGGEHIWMINLKKNGISNYGQLRNVGFARPYG